MLKRVREHVPGRIEVEVEAGSPVWIAREVTLCCLLLSVGIVSIGCNPMSMRRVDRFVPEPGDLLFQDLDSGPLCDAIEQVTTGYDGTNLSHVGLVAKDAHRGLVVIEAVSAGVVTTPLHRFLARSLDARHRPKVLVGRLNPAIVPDCHGLIRRAIEEARALEGRAYDKQFLIGNDSYYCSELVYEAFRRANNGRPLFELQPMTFKRPGSDEPMAVWRTYFADLGVAIPEGCPGINPGSLSRSPVLTIVHEYGALTRKPTAAGSVTPVGK
jgi:hypothetical protein